MTLLGRTRGSLAAAIVLGTLAQAGCGGNEPKIGPPASMAKTGDNQTATVAAAVAIKPSVTIKDAAGKGVPNLVVTFQPASGGGTITGASATTDVNGVATLGSWTLGTIAGTNTITASAATVPGSPATFTATGLAGAATTITKASTDQSPTPTGGNIDSIAVTISDQYGNPVAGESVSFAVTSGGGSVSPATVATKADGRAAARWTVGTALGTANSATATRAGFAAPTVNFNTTTNTTNVTIVRITVRTLVVDSLGSVTPTVQAFDAQGAPVSGAAITLVTRNSTIASTSGGNVTGARAGQTFLIASSTDNANAKDSALVVVANIGAPVVTAFGPRFDLKTDTTFTVSVMVDMRTGTEKLGAATLQVTWDTTVVKYVSDAEGSSAVGATLNTTGTAAGVYAMTMANLTGFPGAVEMRRLTFKAVSAVGKVGALSVTVLDLNGITLTNFAAKAVSPFFPFRTR